MDTSRKAVNEVVIVGHFPPPITGQALATQRLAQLLAQECTVHRFNLNPQGSDQIEVKTRVDVAKVRGYLQRRRRLHQTLTSLPKATVLWTAISPTLPGHLRDLITVMPTFQPRHQVFAVIHWGSFARAFQSPFTALTARRMVRRLHAFVFLDEQLGALCAPWIPDGKRLVIPNTIDESVWFTEAEIAAKRRERQQQTSLRLLFLSNMIQSKGYLDVLQAVALLRDRGMHVRADFAGGWEKDEDRRTFEAMVAERGLNSAIHHHGSVRERVRIKALYRNADVFLLPTDYPTEAQPLSIIEAINAGIPVITTRHAGIPAMVREGVEAKFVLPRRHDLIADAVEALGEYECWKQFSDNARRRFLERFSPEEIRHKWTTLIYGT